MSGLHLPLSEHDLELLSAYLDGALTDLEEQALAQRLVREESLRAALDDLRVTRQLLRSLPQLKAPRSFALDPSTYGRGVAWWRRALAFQNAYQLAGAFGAAASLLLVIAGLLLGSASSERTVVPLTDASPALEVAAQPTGAEPLLTATSTASADALGESAPAALATAPRGTSTPPASPPPEIALEAAAEFAAPQPELDEGPAALGVEAPVGSAAATAPEAQEAWPGLIVPPGDADAEADEENALRDAAEVPLAAPAPEKLEVQPSPTAAPTQSLPATPETPLDRIAEAETTAPPSDGRTGRTLVVVGLGALVASAGLLLAGRRGARRA